MQTANFSDGQFVNAGLMNGFAGLVQTSIQETSGALHTPGVCNYSSFSVIAAGLTLNAALPAPFAVLFGSGTLAYGLGTTNGSPTSAYSVSFAGLVPTSGQVTAYLLASAGTVGLSPIQVVGPPVGHPDYDPSFAPFTLFTTVAATIVLSASTTPPDNVNTFELCRFTLSAGQVAISGINQSFVVRAGAQLSRNGEVVTADLAATGVTPGSYTSPDLTIGVDGRITAAVSDSLLPKANTWTGVNNFVQQVGSGAGFLASGFDGGGAQFRATNGSYGAMLRNDGSSAFLLQTAAGNPFGVFNGLRPFSWNLSTGAVQIDGTGVGTVFGGSINTTFLQLRSTGSSANIYTDTSAGFGANDIVFQTGSTFTIIDNGGTVHANGLTAGNINAAGSVTGGFVTSTGNVNAAASVTGNGLTINGNGFFAGALGTNNVISSNGNITAVNGRLRATFGAAGSGDGAAATLLGDFPLSGAGQFQRLPSGFIIIWGSVTAGAPSQVFFPVAFPNACLGLVVSESNANANSWGIGHVTVHGSQNTTAAGYVAWTLSWNGTSWTGANDAQNYIAVGF